MLQTHNCVAPVQHSLAYNASMSFPTNRDNDSPAAATRTATGPGPAVRLRRSGLIAGALLIAGVLVTACGSASPPSGVASVATTTTTSSAAQGGTHGSPESVALAYVNCMRTHGEPNMPDPPAGTHTSVHISIPVGSGINPNSPQFIRATNACKHLLPHNGVTSDTITSAEQADYLKAAACMRSHGIPDFPDPSFQDGTVNFDIRRPLDPSSPQYKNALAICQKLIPAGLPYSSSNEP